MRSSKLTSFSPARSSLIGSKRTLQAREDHAPTHGLAGIQRGDTPHQPVAGGLLEALGGLLGTEAGFVIVGDHQVFDRFAADVGDLDCEFRRFADAAPVGSSFLDS